MANWLMTNDQKSFDLESAFEELEYIYWTKNNNKINEGDIVYIYVTAPTAQVMYQLKVVDFADNSVNTSAQAKFWIQEDQDQEYTGQFIVLQGMKKVDKETLSLRVLKGLGLINEIQGRRNDLSSEGIKFSYIREQFESETIVNDYPDESDVDKKLFPEGGKQTVQVNRYERNPEARAACIKHYRDASGQNEIRCQICEMNFEKTYGSFARDFIHVHHIKPVSEISESYEVNPITDLLPVCPNCHAMLHRNENGVPMTVARLKLLFEVSANSRR